MSTPLYVVWMRVSGRVVILTRGSRWLIINTWKSSVPWGESRFSTSLIERRFSFKHWHSILRRDTVGKKIQKEKVKSFSPSFSFLLSDFINSHINCLQANASSPFSLAPLMFLYTGDNIVKAIPARANLQNWLKTLYYNMPVVSDVTS